MIDPYMLGSGLLAIVMAFGYALEKLEKKGLVESLGVGTTPPEWAQRQNEILILIAQQIEGIDEDEAASYLGHETKPSLDDVVNAD